MQVGIDKNTVMASLKEVDICQSLQLCRIICVGRGDHNADSPSHPFPCNLHPMTHTSRFATTLASAAFFMALIFNLTTPASAETRIIPIETQYIAALGEASATRGTNAETWGLWVLDPGPRGVRLTQSSALLVSRIAPAGWALDINDWWVEEFGRVMEKPVFPVPPGRYVVTNGQFTRAILTVQDKDADGHMAWELSDNTSLIHVTHLGCRAGRYRPEMAGAVCTPGNMAPEQFPVAAGAAMPPVKGCSKQDYQVLIVIGMVEEGS